MEPVMKMMTVRDTLEAENAQLKAALNLVHVIVEHDGADFDGCCASNIVSESAQAGLDGLLKLKAELESIKEYHRVDDLAQATQREARLWELLREAVQCFCVTQKPADYPVDSWINKALTELRRPEEAGTWRMRKSKIVETRTPRERG